MRTRTLIVGAGPYGVGLANELAARREDFVITGIPFSLWFDHTQDLMSIRSDWHTSEIHAPGHRYDLREFLRRNYPDRETEITRKRIPVSIFREYLQDVAVRLQFPVLETLVDTIEFDGSRFRSTCRNEQVIESDTVVVAAGIEPHRYLPPQLQHMPRGKVVHTWDVGAFQKVSDKKVLVVGAGQSAAEAVAGLRRSNAVTWVTRGKPVYFSEPINLPTPVFNLALSLSPLYYFLPGALRTVLARSFVQSTITPDMRDHVESRDVTRAQADVAGLKLSANGAVRSESLAENFDMVVAATGYRYSLENVAFLSPSLRSKIKTVRQIPRLNVNFETTAPGLYMVGGIAEPTHGPAQRFMMGSSHAARKVALHIVSAKP